MVSVGVGTNVLLFFLKQRTAYELRIRDWSAGVGSSDLDAPDMPRYTSNEIGQRATDACSWAAEAEAGEGARVQSIGGTRSAERREGKEGVSTGRSRWSP